MAQTVPEFTVEPIPPADLVTEYARVGWCGLCCGARPRCQARVAVWMVVLPEALTWRMVSVFFA